MNQTGTFERVGPRVAFGEVMITPDQARQFQRLGLQGVKLVNLRVSDTKMFIDMTTRNDANCGDIAADYDVIANTLYTKSIITNDDSYARTNITLLRHRQNGGETRIYNSYTVETVGGEVFRAVRNVGIVRILSRIAFDEANEPIEDIYKEERKIFEVAMKPDDIDRISDDVTRIVSRSLATGGH